VGFLPGGRKASPLGRGSVKLYRDGMDVTGTAANQTMSDNTVPLSIGLSSATAYFNGDDRRGRSL
jgi:hypothetical protein